MYAKYIVIYTDVLLLFVNTTVSESVLSRESDDVMMRF